MKCLSDIYLWAVFVGPVLLITFSFLKDSHLFDLLSRYMRLGLIFRRLQCLLKTEHFIADIIADLYSHLLLSFEFLTAPILQDSLTLLVCTFVFPTPFLMFVYKWEKHEFTTGLTGDFQNVDKLLQNMRTRANSQDTRTLERAVFLPFFNASFAEKFATVITLHRLS